MTGTFKANNPYNTFLLLIYGVALKLPMFLYPTVPQPQLTDGFLFRWLLTELAPVGSKLTLIYPLITFLLLYTQAVTFNQLVNGQKMMQKPNYLTGMAYLLITSLFKEWNVLSAPLIVNTLLVWVWAKMSGLNTNQKPVSALFNIGITIGIAIFFYFPSVAFAALIIFGLVILRPFQLSEWLIALLGIVTPYYFLLAFVFLMDKWKDYKLPGVAFSIPKFYHTGWMLAAVSIVLFASIVGLFYIQQNLQRQIVQVRKSWYLIFLYFIVAISIPFINATSNFGYWILCAVPLSLFTGSAFLYPQNKWFPRLLHWLMIAFVIAFGYLIK